MKQVKRFFIIAAIITASAFSVKAQDLNPPVLPDFTALIKTGKIQLDFISGFRDVKQIGVQRSLDSVLNFNTIGYISLPNESRNAYLDNKPLPGTNYYRLFILFNSGRYFYSKTKPAVPDSTINASQKLQLSDVNDAMSGEEDENEEKISWHPSNYIYTTADGNVNIRLPDAPKKKFSVKFYETDGTFLFEIKEVTEPFLILEKAIFLHSGWFNFEVYDNGKLFEKWSLYIPLNYRS